MIAAMERIGPEAALFLGLAFIFTLMAVACKVF